MVHGILIIHARRLAGLAAWDALLNTGRHRWSAIVTAVVDFLARLSVISKVREDLRPILVRSALLVVRDVKRCFGVHAGDVVRGHRLR